MTHSEIEKLILVIEELVPVYMAIPEDYAKSQGVASLCIIDENGQIYGKVFGSDKLRCRDSYRVAYTKASQVWITGIKTNDYEKLVFNNEIDPQTYGIKLPDLVGWFGGQPITLQDGTKLSVGFSGFRGTSDLEIVLKAVEKLNKHTLM
ncbi:MAG: hypothetical protein WC384_03165 [Prolixibacteraceae bacterium]|jgi:glc operon protein GlcG